VPNKQRLHLLPNVDDVVHLRDIPWGPLVSMLAIVVEADTKMAVDTAVEEEGATEVGEATTIPTIVVVVGATTNPMMEMEMIMAKITTGTNVHERELIPMIILMAIETNKHDTTAMMIEIVDTRGQKDTMIATTIATKEVAAKEEEEDTIEVAIEEAVVVVVVLLAEEEVEAAIEAEDTNRNKRDDRNSDSFQGVTFTLPAAGIVSSHKK